MSRWIERARELAPLDHEAGSTFDTSDGFGIRHESGGPDQSPVWSAELAAVLAMERPPMIPGDRWQQALADAERFIREWGGRAVAAGWVAEDLFDVHPTAPAARYDLMGLALLIGAGDVVALDERTATIRNRRGNCLRWFRYPRPGALPLWLLREGK